MSMLKWTLALCILAPVVGCGPKEDPALDTAAPKTTNPAPKVPPTVEGKALRELPPPAGGAPTPQ